MRTEIVATVVGGIVAVLALGFHFLEQKDKREQEVKIAQFTSVGGTDEVVTHDCDTIDTQSAHDWECKYVIEDGYNGNGKQMFHYVDSYVRNVDRSISFVDNEGLVTTIPYPYFHIHVNNRK